MNKITLLMLTVILLVTSIAISGCGGTSTVTQTGTVTQTATITASGSFKIIGSNTVTPLSAVWAEGFMAMNPDVVIAVSGPGSGAGIAALINGTTDICQASRGIKTTEIDQAQAVGVNPYEIKVAVDALSVIVHPSNPVSELTIAQLSAIYTGNLTNWNEVGGNDAEILVLSRDTNSGTHVFFKENVVQMRGLDTENKALEFGSGVLLLPSTKEGVDEVEKNPNAIFYPGLGYLTDNVKPMAVKKTANSAGVLPSLETAVDGTYPITRPLFYYTNGEPEGTIKAYIDYCLSVEGQEKVTGVGYVPLQ
jgi:phosphate transport system substrate-binding protein